MPSKWRLTIGSKVEHNDYSAFEIQPTARVLWTPGRSTSAWGAITRAVRTPSRVETDFTTASFVSASPTLTFVRLLPNPDFQPENLVVYEVGYRARILPRLYITVSGFYNDLNDTLSTDLQPAVAEIPPAPAPPRLILPVDFGNGIQGHSHGVEVTADARPAPWWRVTANYAFLDVDVSKVPGGIDMTQERTYEGLAPHHQVQLGSSFDVAEGWSIDWFLRYVSDLPAGPVPGYSASDVRIARQLSPRLEVSVVGQDLFADHHLEWTSAGKVEINRSVYARDDVAKPMTRFLMGAVAVVAMLQVAHGQGTAAAPPDRLTSQLQAAFVTKFPQFVEWPAPVLDGRTTLTVCVGFPDPFGSDLNELVAGETVNGKQIVARQVRNEHDLDECQVLFLPRRGSGPHPLLRRASTRPILTISDDPSFLDDGGIILLRVVEGRIRFDVDVDRRRSVSAFASARSSCSSR